MPNDRVSFQEFIRLVLDAIEATGLDYCIGGAVAVWAWGEPRTTQDVDLVINLPGSRIQLLSQELEKRHMLVPPDILIDLLIQPEGDLPVNAIHLDSGYKAELFLLRMDDPFRSAALARRRLIDLGKPLGQVYVHAPEDLILNKLIYYRLGQQSKHIRDIAGMKLISADEIDWITFNYWLDQLDLVSVWEEVQASMNALLS